MSVAVQALNPSTEEHQEGLSTHVAAPMGALPVKSKWSLGVADQTLNP